MPHAGWTTVAFHNNAGELVNYDIIHVKGNLPLIMKQYKDAECPIKIVVKCYRIGGFGPGYIEPTKPVYLIYKTNKFVVLELHRRWFHRFKIIYRRSRD